MHEVYPFTYTQLFRAYLARAKSFGTICVFINTLLIRMAHDDRRFHDEEEGSELLADPVEVDLGEDDDDEKDPLIAGDEETEEKDWM